MDSEILITKKSGEEVSVKKEPIIGFDGDNKYEGQNVQVDSGRLIDPQTGQPRVIRSFTFKGNPDFWKKNKGLKGINKQELFNNHWHLLEIELWKDGLIVDQAYDPKLTFRKGYYIIQLVCMARLGVFVNDKPRNLNDYLSPKRK